MGSPFRGRALCISPHLDVRSLCFHERLIDVTTVPTYLIDFGVKFRRAVPDLAEQLLAPAARRAGVVYRDVVIVGVHRLLHERLVDYDAVHLDVVVVLVDLRLEAGGERRRARPGAADAVGVASAAAMTVVAVAVAGARGGVPVPAHEHVARDVYPTLLQQVVHPSSVHERSLHPEIVEKVRPAERDVRLRLLQGI